MTGGQRKAGGRQTHVRGRVAGVMTRQEKKSGVGEKSTMEPKYRENEKGVNRGMKKILESSGEPDRAQLERHQSYQKMW